MRRTRVAGWLAGAVVVGLIGPAPVAIAAAGGAAAADGDDVRLNQIQVVGSHNSYHREAPLQEAAVRAVIDPAGQRALEYTHAALDTQFGSQKVRQIELDVFADPTGGLYARPLLRLSTGGRPLTGAMTQPGSKVLHVQDIDYHTRCQTFVECLTQVRAWSDANRGHVPIAVLVELKDQPVPNGDLPFTVPLAWDASRIDALEAEITSVFPRDRRLTPDDVRGDAGTLEQAVLTRGWPTLGETRGKVMFLMDNGGGYRDAYLQGRPGLRGAAMFTNATPGQPDAAFVKENDPTGANTARIQDLVRRGYVVRTRADADTLQARNRDTRTRDAALASGAQWVSTDYPARGMALRFLSTYSVTLPGGVPARCNPVTKPAGCTDATLDRR